MTDPRLVAATLAALAPLPLAAQGFLCDYEPQTREVILNTDFTQIVPRNCIPVNVAGGVFTFRSVRIPVGVTVRGQGSNPMVWIVAGDFLVEGTLDLRGGDGARVDTLNSPNFPAPGGIGVCGGGRGGAGSPNTTQTSPTGETGAGSGNATATGGQGGLASCNATGSCTRGSGGGGGSFGTIGDPSYKLLGSATSLVQQLGRGGLGCASRALPGGAPGVPVFGDPRADNDYFGVGIDVNRRAIVLGELAWPTGGAGGGGGGDDALLCNGNPNWLNDAKGGGGGGGGGALVIFALGRVVVGPTGKIVCDGGHGGGGEQAGSNNKGGGGGGGSGGMVVIYTTQHIEIHARGETYANNDFDFPISADGGIGRQGAFNGVPIDAKYPPPARAAFDLYGAGGMGGLGVVQLMAPPGFNADNTNTVLDDNVHVLRGGVRIVGAEKQRFLAWRGFLDQSGTWVDDAGIPTNIGDREGDIRPAPRLLPVW